MTENHELRTTPRALPDLITSSRGEQSEVLFKMSRYHANALGAYLNARDEIAPLPHPIKEILNALTLRLVAPPGARWATLRDALAGQPIITPGMWDEWKRQQAEAATARHRRPDAGDPSDLRADLRPAELGDADGTSVSEVPMFWRHLSHCEKRTHPSPKSTCTCGAEKEGK